MLRLTVVFFVLYVTALCEGNSLRFGAWCPRVIAMGDFDFDRYLGEWYVIQRFNPMALCTKLIFEKSPDGVYSMNETSRPRISRPLSRLGLGSNFYNEFSESRDLVFLRNDTQSIFGTETDSIYSRLKIFGVIDTDYDNFAVVWSCDRVALGSMQNIDILSRTRTPEENVLSTTMNVVMSMNVDYSALSNVDQSMCSFTNGGSTSTEDENTNNIVII